MQSPQDRKSSVDVMEDFNQCKQKSDGMFHQILYILYTRMMHLFKMPGGTEGEHGGPLAYNKIRNDQESSEFGLKDKELFIFLNDVAWAIALIASSLLLFALGYYSMGYPATTKLQKEHILAGTVAFMAFSVTTVGVVHCLEARANAIDLATTMVMAEITYAFVALCYAAMSIAKAPWFTVVPLFLGVFGLFVAYYLMLKKIFKFKLGGQ